MLELIVLLVVVMVFIWNGFRDITHYYESSYCELDPGGDEIRKYRWRPTGEYVKAKVKVFYAPPMPLSEFKKLG